MFVAINDPNSHAIRSLSLEIQILIQAIINSVAKLSRQVCRATLCCAIVASLVSWCDVAECQSLFRSPEFAKSTIAKSDFSKTRIAQETSRQRPEYQFPARTIVQPSMTSPSITSSTQTPSGFVEQGFEGRPQTFGINGLGSQEISLSPLSGDVFETSNNGLGRQSQGFSGGAFNPSGDRAFQTFIPNQNPSSGDANANPQNMSVQEAIQRYNANESGIDEYSSTNFGAFQDQTSENMEALPPALIDESDPITQDGLEVIIQRYSNGRPRIIRHVAQDAEGNYVNQGPWKVLTESGKPVADGFYDNGLMDGQWRREHSADSSGLFDTRPFNLFQGPYLSVARFSEGKLDGVWTIYDRNRTKIFEMPYKKGVRNGVAVWKFPNQATMREATFKDGLIDGEILEYAEDKIVKREQYVEGRKIVRNTTFYRPKVKRSEEYFLGSKLEPETEDDWWEARPTPFLSRGPQTQDGSSMTWYENGQPKKRGQFKEGLPVGQFTWWHSNGNKRIEGFYVDGEKSRRWTWWHENGFKQFEGTFKDDQPAGIWRSWFDDGKLRTEKDYSDSAQSAAETKEPKPSDDETIELIEETDSPKTTTEVDDESNPFQGEPGEIVVDPVPESLPSPPVEQDTSKENEATDSTDDTLEEIVPQEVPSSEFRKPKVPGEELNSVLGSEDAQESIGNSTDDNPIELLNDGADEGIGEIPLDEPKTSESIEAGEKDDKQT